MARTESPFRAQVAYDSLASPLYSKVTGCPEGIFFAPKNAGNGLLAAIRELIREILTDIGAAFSPITKMTKAESLITEWDRKQGLVPCSTGEWAESAKSLRSWQLDHKAMKAIEHGYRPALGAFIDGISRLTGAKSPVISVDELHAAHQLKPHGGDSQESDFKRQLRALKGDTASFPDDEKLVLPGGFEETRKAMIGAYREVRVALHDYNENATSDRAVRLSDAATTFSLTAATWSAKLKTVVGS